MTPRKLTHRKVCSASAGYPLPDGLNSGTIAQDHGLEPALDLIQMPLSAGAKLGLYEIIAPEAEGGRVSAQWKPTCCVVREQDYSSEEAAQAGCEQCHEDSSSKVAYLLGERAPSAVDAGCGQSATGEIAGRGAGRNPASAEPCCGNSRNEHGHDSAGVAE